MAVPWRVAEVDALGEEELCTWVYPTLSQTQREAIRRHATPLRVKEDVSPMKRERGGG